MALDALTTSFAFVLYQMLANAGFSSSDYQFAVVGAMPQRWESVKDGTHAGTITIEPFTSIAHASGFRVLDLRTRFGSDATPLTETDKHIDLAYYKAVVG